MDFGKVPDYLKQAVLEPFDLLEEVEHGVPEAGFVLPFIPSMATTAPAKELALDASDDLEALVKKSMRKLDAILDLTLDQDDEAFATILRVQMTGVQTVLNTQVRVDDQRLKKKQSDNLPKLLDALARHDKSRRADSARLVNP
jgi:hypothetical protein